MSKARRRRGRFGARIPVERLIREDDELRDWDDLFVGQGYARSPTVRPYLARSGVVTLRFVWRNRADGSVARVVWRTSLAELRDAA